MSPRSLTRSDFLAHHRGGGLLTETMTQRLAARAAVGAHRLGLAPTMLTLANLILGVSAGAGVIVLASPMARGDVPHSAVGLTALALWHAAYLLDCADGQLARATGQTSAAGKRVDVLVDVAIQSVLVGAVAAVGTAYRPQTSSWLVAVFAATWMVNVVTSILETSEARSSLLSSTRLAIRFVKLVRDYAAVVTAVGVTLAFAPWWTAHLMAATTCLNGLFLAASIAHAAKKSLRARPA